MAEEKGIEKGMKVVCFNLGNEEYGLDVNQVLGVNPMLEITHVPKAPGFVEGVIRIREKIIPVIDLRKQFGMEKKEYSKKTRIIVAKVGGVRVGIIVDGASEVISIPAQNMEPPSPVLNHHNLLKGVGRLEKKLLLLVDLDKILSMEEVETLAEVHKKVEPKRRKEKTHAK